MLVQIGDRAEKIDLTVLLPAYNEASAITAVLDETYRALGEWNGRWEIVVVDDGSTDQTALLAREHGCRVLSHQTHLGYGSAVKTGLESARGVWVAMLDADGSYQPRDVLMLLERISKWDQINGARHREQEPPIWMRATVKWILRMLAQWISGERIADLNTGLRVFRRDLMRQY